MRQVFITLNQELGFRRFWCDPSGFYCPLPSHVVCTPQFRRELPTGILCYLNLTAHFLGGWNSLNPYLRKRPLPKTVKFTDQVIGTFNSSAINHMASLKMGQSWPFASDIFHKRSNWQFILCWSNIGSNWILSQKEFVVDFTFCHVNQDSKRVNFIDNVGG